MVERPLFVRRAGPLALRRSAGSTTLAAAGLEQDKLVWLGTALGGDTSSGLDLHNL
jgi:hypothetical protein